MTPGISRWSTVPLAQVPPMPWRNGGGSTRELLAWPDSARWHMRVSVAEIDRDGPFSRFPESERWLSLLQGSVRLQVGGGAQVITAQSEALRFHGKAQVDCALLGGPAQALNLMARPGAGRMLRTAGGYRGEVPARCLLAVYAPHGGTIGLYDDELLDLAPQQLAWRLVEQQGPVVVLAEQAVWMEVRL